MKVALLAACISVLAIGCIAETEPVMDSDESTPAYPSNGYLGDGEARPLCKPFVQEFHINGETIRIYEPALCPLAPPLDEILMDPWDESIEDVLENPRDELMLDEVIHTHR